MRLSIEKPFSYWSSWGVKLTLWGEKTWKSLVRPLFRTRRKCSMCKATALHFFGSLCQRHGQSQGCSRPKQGANTASNMSSQLLTCPTGHPYSHHVSQSHRRYASSSPKEDESTKSRKALFQDQAVLFQDPSDGHPNVAFTPHPQQPDHSGQSHHMEQDAALKACASCPARPGASLSPHL